MPWSKRPRRERTHDWQKIQQYTLWPEQKIYELLRPVVLFNEAVAERAQETGSAERTLYRKAEQFEEYGMASLFPKDPPTRSEDKSRSLPPDMRQLIVDLHAEHPAFRSNGARGVLHGGAVGRPEGARARHGPDTPGCGGRRGPGAQ